MALLEDLMKQAGGVADLVRKNPQAVAAVLAMLNSRDNSVGAGNGGLGGIMAQFQQAGLGDMMSSWISTGPNPPISPSQLESVLGGDVLAQFGSRAGVGSGQAGSVLASLLPAVIDQLTPEGRAPQQQSLDSTLGSLLGMLGK
jgi:uncharacterized protein YidB (DUF937 family)